LIYYTTTGLAIMLDLYPEDKGGRKMESKDWDWEEVGKALLRRAAVAPFEKYIKEPLEEIIGPVLEGKGIDYPSFMEVIIVLVFIHVDLMGYFYTGDSSLQNTSKNAVKFLREYFGRIDTRYEKVGGLLFTALRHGWIHKYTPKRFELEDGAKLDFSWGFTENRAEHLKIKTDAIEGRGGYRLFIGLILLYKDLISAMDLYAEDLRHNQDLSDIFKKAFEARRKPEKEEIVRNLNYIETDFDFVREQISNL
jgi:hypothetical protein